VARSLSKSQGNTPAGKRIVLVGGGGYVGCVLTEELLARGYSVRIIDRMFYGREPIAALEPRIELIDEDMRELDVSHFEDCDAVVNLGGMSNDPTAEFNPRANAEMNTHASIRVAEMAKQAGVSRHLFASTASIYGRTEMEGLLDEDAPVDPRAPYALSKYLAEQAILALADGDFVSMAYRKGTVFGWSPRMRYDLVVNTFVKDAMMNRQLHLDSGGVMWRPLIDVRDVARAYITALECDPDLVRGQMFNLAAVNLQIFELAEITKAALADIGIDVEIDFNAKPRPKRSYRMSFDRVREVLGFEAEVTVEASIANIIAKVQEHGQTNWSHPRYYNIEWMTLLESMVTTIGRHGYVLEKPEFVGGDAMDDPFRQWAGAVRVGG
jgi:nucleoside-diphosphate-sugar epimerase